MKYDGSFNGNSIGNNSYNTFTNNPKFLNYDNLFINKPSCLDDYEILDIIGEGSYGKVYKAKKYDRLHQTDEFFAIKHIAIPKNQSVINDIQLSYTNSGIKDTESINEKINNQLKAMVDASLKEVNIMNELAQYAGYKYIVKIETSAIVDRTNSIGYDVFIIMELLISLDQFIIQNINNYLNIIDVVQIGIDICSALEQCEYNGIIHRDIKPSNIFLNINKNNGTIINYKLGDFGTARYTDINNTLTMNTGTWEYMSPQQAKGIFSYTNDLYSLGLVMYRLLNKFRMPFCPLPNEKREISSLDKELAKRRLDSGQENIPAPVDADRYLSEIVLKSCAFNMEDRYQHAKDLKKDLLDYKNGIYVPNTTFSHTNHKNKSVVNAKKKKSNKHTIAYVLALLILGVSGKFILENLNTSSKDFKTEPYKDGVMINNYMGNNQNIKIPSTIDGKNVVAIANATFVNSNIKSVVIPNTVKELHNGAFKGCSNLEKIILGNSIESIEDDCFDSCIKLKSIDLPSTLKKFDETFFDNCPMLSDINIDENNPNYTSIDGIVFSKDTSTLVCYPEGKKNETYTIPNNVTNIAMYALENNDNLKEIIVSSNVSTIEEGAFINCDNLEKIVIDTNVRSIQKNLLDGSDKAVIYCEKESYAMRYAIDNKLVYNTGDGNVEYTYTYSKEYSGLKAKITSYFGKDEDVTIPNTIDGFEVVGISEGAFTGNNFIKSVIVPEGVISIDTDAFKDCSNLKVITLPSTLEFLSQGVFMNDLALQTINIPDSLTTLYDYTFCGCTALESIEIADTMEQILGNDIFTGCNNLTIRCKDGSIAQKYAKEHSIAFSIY